MESFSLIKLNPRTFSAQCSINTNESAEDLLQPLQKLMSQAVWQIQECGSIKKIHFILYDKRKTDIEKFEEICWVVTQRIQQAPLRDCLADNFCKLFKKEVLDYLTAQRRNFINKNKTEISFLLQKIPLWLSGEMVAPSLLRELLEDLRFNVRLCANNFFSTSSGINQLYELLEDLPWTEDENLAYLLQHARKILTHRLNLTYLTRDPFTYFLYNNFFRILTLLDVDNLVNIEITLQHIKKLAAIRVAKTQQALNNLFCFLLNLKYQVDRQEWNNKGKRFGVLENKLPDGFFNLRSCLKKLPASMQADPKQYIQIINIFMEIKSLLAFKLKTMPPLRHSDVHNFYKTCYEKLFIIYQSLNLEDKEKFLFISDRFAKADKILMQLAIPKFSALLNYPETLLNGIVNVSTVLEMNEVIEPQASCSHDFFN